MRALLESVIFSVSVVAYSGALGAELASAKPEDVGMSGARLARIGEV